MSNDIDVADLIKQIACDTDSNDQEINILGEALEEAVAMLSAQDQKKLLRIVKNSVKEWRFINT